MERTLALETTKKIGKEIRLYGWVNRRRDHGKLVFIDLKDRSGIVQVVGEKGLSDLRISDVIELVGKVRERPKELVNPKLPTGKVEVRVEKENHKLEFQNVRVSNENPECGSSTQLSFNIINIGSKKEKEIRENTSDCSFE